LYSSHDRLTSASRVVTPAFSALPITALLRPAMRQLPTSTLRWSSCSPPQPVTGAHPDALSLPLSSAVRSPSTFYRTTNLVNGLQFNAFLYTHPCSCYYHDRARLRHHSRPAREPCGDGASWLFRLEVFLLTDALVFICRSEALAILHKPVKERGHESHSFETRRATFALMPVQVPLCLQLYLASTMCCRSVMCQHLELRDEVIIERP
jgi:hypothetical protein